MVDQQLRNEVGQVWAEKCGISELWRDDGPTAELREFAFERVASKLSSQQIALLRIALDYYDGSGNITLAEVFRRLEGDDDAWFDLLVFFQQIPMSEGSYVAEWVASERCLHQPSRLNDTNSDIQGEY